MNTRIGTWFAVFLGLVSLAKGGPEYEFRPIEMPSQPFQPQDFTPGGSAQFTKGTYNGLIVSPGTIVPEQSGSFRLNLDNEGDYSANMITGDYSTPVYGYFNSQGRSGVDIYKKEWDDCYCYYYYRHVWTVILQLIPGTDEIEGSVYHV